MVRKLITDIELRAMAGDAKQVVIPADSILTPSAQDMARFMKVTVVRAEAKPREAESEEKNPSGEEIRRIVKSVLEQQMKPICPNPRVTHVKAASVRLEPFDQAPPGQNIRLKDVITAREANLAAGFMSFDHSELPWHLTYDEVDYVVEGVFTLQANGRNYTCQPGDVLYIPKDTQVVFGSPATTRVFYVTYPANWAEV